MGDIKPTRQAHSGGVSVQIADLDAILGGAVWFKLHGQSFEIVPVTTQAYLQFVQGVNDFQALSSKEELTLEEANEKTLAIFKPLVPAITVDDIMKCTQPQIAALFSLVIERVQGKTGLDKKKLNS